VTYDTVVFDNDGVLVGRTSFDVLREATQDTFEQFGVTDPDPDHVEDMTIGATPDRSTTSATTYDLHPDTFWRARDDTMSRAQQEEARAGRKTFYDDVDTLADLDAAMGIVSSNQQATVDFLLDHFDVGHHFGAAYGREATIESLDRRKPNSHYIDRALSDLDADSALFSSVTTSPTSAPPRTPASTRRSSAGPTGLTGASTSGPPGTSTAWTTCTRSVAPEARADASQVPRAAVTDSGAAVVASSHRHRSATNCRVAAESSVRKQARGSTCRRNRLFAV